MSSLAQNAALEELARGLYNFLPGSPHPFGNPNLSFPAVAGSLGLADSWPSNGNKHQRIRVLLEQALNRGKFSDLIKEIASRAMTHHKITRDEILRLNRVIERVGFRIPELNDSEFLNGLSGAPQQPSEIIASASLHERLSTLSVLYKELRQLDEVRRGFAFEKFLADLFWTFGLAPRSSFRNKGEQIDGSFNLGSETYLLSARWRSKPADRADLVEFSGTVQAKARWSRGFFVSQSGFGTEGLNSFLQGRPTNIVCMNGVELSVVLQNKLGRGNPVQSSTCGRDKPIFRSGLGDLS
jgi:Restriction endonuclease